MSAIVETAAARTLVKRLERAGIADSDNESTADWLATLAAYEQVMAKEIRMATFTLSNVNIRQPVTEEDADVVAYARLAEAIAAFDAHGALAREMIAWLTCWLDIIEALPAEAGVEAHKRSQRYLAYRYGKLPLLPPLAKRQPHHWPFSMTLQGHEQEGWRVAVTCRQAWRILTPAQQEQAIADFGPFYDPHTLDNPLWAAHYPAAEQRALDQRASALGVDPRPRAVAKGR